MSISPGGFEGPPSRRRPDTKTITTSMAEALAAAKPEKKKRTTKKEVPAVSAPPKDVVPEAPEATIGAAPASEHDTPTEKIILSLGGRKILSPGERTPAYAPEPTVQFEITPPPEAIRPKDDVAAVAEEKVVEMEDADILETELVAAEPTPEPVSEPAVPSPEPIVAATPDTGTDDLLDLSSEVEEEESLEPSTELVGYKTVEPYRAGSSVADYALLGIAFGATAQQIRAAYVERIKTAHPDHGGDPAVFKNVNEAYHRIVGRDRPPGGGGGDGGSRRAGAIPLGVMAAGVAGSHGGGRESGSSHGAKHDKAHAKDHDHAKGGGFIGWTGATALGIGALLKAPFSFLGALWKRHGEIESQFSKNGIFGGLWWMLTGSELKLGGGGGGSGHKESHAPAASHGAGHGGGGHGGGGHKKEDHGGGGHGKKGGGGGGGHH